MKKRAIITTIIMIILSIGLIGCNADTKYNVNFVVDNEIYATVNTFGQEVVSIPENPIKEGYEFEGWFWDDGKWERPFAADSLLNEPISNDINVYAKWSINKNEQGTKAELKVNFVVDNEIYATVNTFGQEVVSIPECPIKEGYEFEGWFWDDGKWERPFAADSLLNEPISNDINVYAKWSMNELTQGTQALFEGFSKISETEYEMVVSNSVDKISLGRKVTVSSNSSWSLTSDIYGNFAITSKVATLEIGDNFYYVLVTAENGQCEMYELKIRRKPIYTVSFDTDGGNFIDSQLVEEGNLSIEPTCTREGYTFEAWDYDFAKPIMQNVNIKAEWRANENTLYKVEYYFQNYEDYGYPSEPELTLEMSGTTDTIVFAEKKNFEHFVLDESSSTLSGSVLGDGSQVLKLFYGRKRYTLSNSNERSGTISMSGVYVYRPDFSMKVSVKVNKGYEFDGWYSGDRCLSNEPEFIYCADKNVQARFKYVDGMENFCFDSTETTCVITGIQWSADENLVIPKCVTDIKANAFINNEKVRIIRIENGITKIKSGTFAGCKNLTDVIIDDGITFIGAEAFSGCEKLSNITIPISVTSIGQFAFSNCENLSKIVLSDNITQIQEGTFFGCTNLSEVVLSNSLNEIGKRAFASCYSLENIVLPSSLKIISEQSFLECKNLSSITFNDGVTNIGDKAFEKCEKLGASVTIPSSLISFGYSVFSGCSKLYEIVNLSNLDLSYLGDFYIVVQNGESQTKNVNGFLVVQGQHPFYSNLTCPHIVRYIGEESEVKISSNDFYPCVIREGAFADNIEIRSVTFEIDDYLIVQGGAFSNCCSLEKIVFTNSRAPRISSNAFEGCINIKNVYYYGTKYGWSRIIDDKYDHAGYTDLSIATVYYYSEKKPSSDGTYWYYDENGEVVLW